jgi:hypothetical protein
VANYTSGQAKGLVAIALVVSGGVAVGGALYAGKTPQPRVALGLVLSGAFLSGLAEAEPKLAGGLALLMMTSAVFVVGPSFVQSFGSTINGKPAVPATQGKGG